MLLKPENFKGRIMMLDYYWKEDLPMSNQEFSKAVFDICENAIACSKLKIVHKNMCLLPIDGDTSEEGSTSFFSLDSSHCSSHIYWKSRLMALDVFGCSTDDDYGMIVNTIDEKLKVLTGGLIVKCFYGSQARFHFPTER